MRRVGFVVCSIAFGAALAACGSPNERTITGTGVTTAGDACAFIENIEAPGVGPTVIFVTRGAGAQDACDAEVADPRNKPQDIRPAYIPAGAPVCAYSDTHDPAPEGGRTYEIYGEGAAAVCAAMAPTARSGGGQPVP